MSSQYRHVLLLLGWVVYFIFYFLTERLIPESACHLMHSPLDDRIPFLEGFVVFYVSWFFLVAGFLLIYFLYDVERFKKLQIFIIITQVVAMIVYIVWPSRHDLRPVVMPRNNIFTWILKIIYDFDTPTGVCPSLHVGYSLGILSVYLKDPKNSRRKKALMFLWIFLICCSTMFIKQHSVLDVAAAIPLGLLAEVLVYGKSYWLPLLRHNRER